MFGKYEKNSLAPIDALQKQLTAAFIDPYVQDFEAAFYVLRNAIDELWLKGESTLFNDKKTRFLTEQIEIQKKKVGNHIALYPIGRCYNITKIAFAYIHHFELKDEYSAFYYLNDFIAKGGVFKIIWGEVRHEFFQTAIQIGNWCFDVSNDTVITTKPKILKRTFDSPENEYFDVNSIHQYIAVKRNYHQCEIYFNSLFPAINNFFPLLIKYKNNQILIDDSRHVADLCELNNFKFLEEHQLPELPLEIGQIITEYLKEKLTRREFEQWFNHDNNSPFQNDSVKLYRTVRQINFILKGIRP